MQGNGERKSESFQELSDVKQNHIDSARDIYSELSFFIQLNYDKF